MVRFGLFKVQLTSSFAKLPTRGSPQAAGLDLYAAHPAGIEPGKRAMISLGFKMALTPGFYMRIAPRSGTALRNGIDVLAGVVDPDYREDVGVILINFGTHRFDVEIGERIAQGIITPYELCDPEKVDHLPTSQRIGGFGSTGT